MTVSQQNTSSKKKWWIGIPLFLIVVLLVEELVIRQWLQRGALPEVPEQRVVRTEKFSKRKPFETRWGEHTIWVIKRSSDDVQAIFNERDTADAAPLSVFRSVNAEFFVIQLDQNEQGQYGIRQSVEKNVETELNEAVIHWCLQFDYHRKAPLNQRFRCELETGEVFFDARGMPVADGWLPLAVPPHYYNRQQHLVIGGHQHKDG